MFHCVGCGTEIPWDGESIFSYTCPCDATLFSDEDCNVAIPFSILQSTLSGLKRPLPHLGDLVGTSDYTSPEKERLTSELKERGFIWMEECTGCLLDGRLERRNKRKELEKTLNQVATRYRLGELTPEEALEETRIIQERSNNLKYPTPAPEKEN